MVCGGMAGVMTTPMSVLTKDIVVVYITVMSILSQHGVEMN